MSTRKEGARRYENRGVTGSSSRQSAGARPGWQQVGPTAGGAKHTQASSQDTQHSAAHRSTHSTAQHSVAYRSEARQHVAGRHVACCHHQQQANQVEAHAEKIQKEVLRQYTQRGCGEVWWGEVRWSSGQEGGRQLAESLARKILHGERVRSGAGTGATANTQATVDKQWSATVRLRTQRRQRRDGAD